MEIDCPYYKNSHICAWCNLSDNPCMVEYGEPEDCDEYMNTIKERENESS